MHPFSDQWPTLRQYVGAFLDQYASGSQNLYKVRWLITRLSCQIPSALTTNFFPSRTVGSATSHEQRSATSVSIGRARLRCRGEQSRHKN